MSLPLLLYAGVVAVGFHVFAIAYGEPTLHRWRARETPDLMPIWSKIGIDIGATPGSRVGAWQRLLWEGPLVIEETSPGGRRGVGTLAQCVTGRLATLEEIVD